MSSRFQYSSTKQSWLRYLLLAAACMCGAAAGGCHMPFSAVESLAPSKLRAAQPDVVVADRAPLGATGERLLARNSLTSGNFESRKFAFTGNGGSFADNGGATGAASKAKHAPEVTGPASQCRTLHGDGWPAQPAGLHRGDAFEANEVVLTFDDGPYPGRTERVLDALSKHSFQATFFVQGRRINRDSYPLLQRMEREGHTIGSHAFNHQVAMAAEGGRQQSIDYITGQHEVTRVLIEVALLATGPDDFDELYERVVGLQPQRRVSRDVLREQHRAIVERHAKLLVERGFPNGRYEVVYSRPPGGGPYLGRVPRLRQRTDQALRRAGMVNIMWHAQAGDVHPTRSGDYLFLVNSMRSAAAKGGVLLVHDFIQQAALETALAWLAEDAERHVVSLDDAMLRKYGCSASHVVERMWSGR